jgi:hypothetical protein
LTDPLTARELVEKSHEYMERLCKECSKSLLDDYNRSHRRFEKDSLPTQISSDIVTWFGKRDRNLNIRYDSSNVLPQSNQLYLRFKGNTKDADFAITASVISFSVPYTAASDGSSCFIKSISFAANKNDFARRKPC